MKKWLVPALIGLAALASAQSSRTGESLTAPVNVAFRIGYAFPFETEGRDAFGKNLLGVGMDYFLDRPLLAGGETSLSLDWFNIGRSGTDTATSVPLLLNHRWYMAKEDDTMLQRYYFFVGAGVSFVNADDANRALITGRVGAGWELTRNVFVEGSVTFTEDKQDTPRGNLVGAFLGYRF